MSNRMLTDTKEMERRWNLLLAEMKKQGIDCLLMYSTDRTYSSYLRYVTDFPTMLYPFIGLFSEKGSSVVGHGAQGDKINPPPLSKLDNSEARYLLGGVAVQDFTLDQLALPAAPTTVYAPNLWSEAIGNFIKKYNYKHIGLVGTNIIPIAYVDYLKENFPDLEFTDATLLVDKIKSVKSPYEIEIAQHCVLTIDQLMAAAPAAMKVGSSIREIGRRIRRMADDADCIDLNIMLGKHPTMPMFSRWLCLDEDVVGPNDCIELMVEVSNYFGFWGETARVYSMGEPIPELVEASKKAFAVRDFTASQLIPGARCNEVFEKCCEFIKQEGFAPERRFLCHGQGYDVVESPFIRPECTFSLMENQFVAIHPSMYNPEQSVGCFICDNYLITPTGGKIMSSTPAEIIRVF